MRSAGVPVSAVVTALKQFFSELREPIIPLDLYDDLKDAVSKSTTGLLLHIVTVEKASPYLITERRVPELIPVLGSQPAGDVSHKPGGRLPLLSTRPAVTLATLNRLLSVLMLSEQRHDGCEQFA